MGSAASVPKAQNNASPTLLRQPEISLRSGDNLTIFVDEMIALCPPIEGLSELLQSKLGRAAFIEFLRDEYEEEDFWFFRILDDMRGKPPTDAEFVSHAELLVATYLSPKSHSTVPVSNELKKNLEAMISGCSEAVPGDAKLSDREVAAALLAAQLEIVNIMALSAFPKFLASKYCVKNFLRQSIDSQDLVNETEQINQIDSDELHLESSYQTRMSLELEKMLAGTSWLSGLLSSIESLPVCVSLAAASRTMRGFPLLYVNAAFETTTGYERSEILGQRGREPGDRAEEESIARLTEALREAKPLKVAITNWRKDGTAFRNLLAIKPIMDQNGDYAFVLGIQFDIGNKDASARKMKMIDDLFRALPDSVVSSPSLSKPNA